MVTLNKKTLLVLAPAVIALGVAGFFAYLNLAFPETRCEGAHLTVPGEYADCVSCHIKTTAKVTQDWQESKHGVMLVKCVVCHGEPDGKGSIPFAANPDPVLICSRCHDPAMQRMVAKYGADLECNTCHPNHQNPMHSDAYEAKIPTTKTTF